MPFLLSSRSACLVGALAFGLAGPISPAFGEEPGLQSPVAGLRTSGPDLEVSLTSPPPEEAAVVLVDAAGVQVAAAPVVVEDGEGRARLAGALAAVPGRGPAYRVLVMADDGSVLGSELPFLVALRCPPEEPCRFQLLSGLAAPGTALVDPALGRALDELPAGTVDQLAAAVAVDSSLRGAALTAAWHWAALPADPTKGACGCVWALEASLPGGSGDGGGVVAGVTARAVSGEDGVRVEQARSASLALRQRCVRTDVQPAETVTVADGSWSTVLEIPRVVLSGCPEPCAPEVAWEVEVEGRSVARVESGPDALAEVSWRGEMDVDGTGVLQLEDGASAPGDVGGETLRRAQWAGDGELVALRAMARAEIAAPGEAADAEAVAAIGWHFAGRGVSSCAQPGQVGVSAASPSRIGPIRLDVPRVPCEPGQIGLLISNGRICLPGGKK